MNALKFGLASALAFVSVAALAQISQPASYISAATTNSTLVKPAAGQVTSLLLVNSSNSPYVLKLYDKVTAPTCGTDTPVQRIPIPTTASGAALPMPFSVPINFLNGIGFCLTGKIADADTTAAAAGIAINIGFK